MSEQTPEPIEEFRKVEVAPLESDDGDDVHDEALERFKQIVSREEESRTLGVQDLIFIDQEGGPWDNSTGFLSNEALQNDSTVGSDDPPPPRYSIDRISPVIEEAVDDQRNSQINIKYHAVGDVDKGLADTFGGLVKNIEVVSDAQDAYDNAFDECQKSGYGGWQIVTRYADESFEQDIFIEPILNATQSLFFGPAKKATKEDALYAFHIWQLDIDEYNRQYPDNQFDKSNWPIETLEQINRNWFNFNDNLIRLAAYWRKRPVRKEIVLMTDGRVLHEEDVEAALAADKEAQGSFSFVAGPTSTLAIQKDSEGKEVRRTVDTYEVERFIMNGKEVLKGPQRWAGKYIPLIPEYGVRSVVNGKETIRGKVRKGKDPQQIYNYGTSAVVKAVALAPKDFYWLTPKMGDGHDYTNMNVDLDPIQYFTPDPEFPGQFPKKAEGPTIQQALMAQVAQAREDISAVVGNTGTQFDGTAADPRSGEAIFQGQQKSERGNTIYMNNHTRALRYTGVQLADLISRLWTTQMQRRIIKPDGEDEVVTVNERAVVEGKEIIINDLSQAKFDVTVDVGPAVASQRQRGAEQLTELGKENAAFAEHTPDLIAKNLDVPGSDELYRRLRRAMIMQGKIEPTDDEREELQIDVRQQVAQELEPELREQITNEAQIRLLLATADQNAASAQNSLAAAALKQDEAAEIAAKVEKITVETEKILEDKVNAALDGMSKMLDNFAKQSGLGMPITIREHDQHVQQSDQIDDEQQDVDGGPTSEQEEQFNLPQQ